MGRKKDDWDDPFLDGFDSDMDFDDIPDKIDHKSRKPVQAAKNIMTSVLKGAGKGALNRTGDLVGNAMPKVRGALGDVTELGRGVRNLTDEFTRDIQGNISSLKQTGRKLLPNVKRYMPTSLYDKLDNKLKTDFESNRRSREQQEEDSRNLSINKSLEEIFNKEQQLNRANIEEKRLDKLVDRQINISQFANVNLSLRYITGFMSTSFTGYMKKSIELKYKHLFVAQDTLKTMKATSILLESKLESIKHNTGLPEIQKIHMGEMFKSKALEKVFGGTAERFSAFTGTYIEKFLKNIKSNIFNSAKESLEMLSSMGEQTADQLEFAREMGDMGMGSDHPGGVMGEMATESIGGSMGKKFVNKHVPGVIKRFKPFIRHAENYANNFKTKGILKLDQFKEKNSWAGGLLGLLAQSIPEFSKHVKVDNLLKDNASAPAIYDKSTRTSIVEIIPGLLGKILKATKDILTGTDNEEEVYDITTRDFVGVSTLKANLKRDIYGSKLSRLYDTTKGLGAMSASYNFKKGSSDTTSFEDVRKDIITFLYNHSLNIIALEPKFIRDYAHDEQDDFNETAENYYYSVFKDIEDPKRVAMVLTRILYNGDTIDKVAVEQVSDSIISKMENDGFRDKFQGLFEVHGYRRFFKDDIKHNTMSTSAIRRDLTADLSDSELAKGSRLDAMSYLNKLKRISAENKEAIDDPWFQSKVAQEFLQNGVVDDAKIDALLKQYQDMKIEDDPITHASGKTKTKNKQRGRSRSTNVYNYNNDSSMGSVLDQLTPVMVDNIPEIKNILLELKDHIINKKAPDAQQSQSTSTMSSDTLLTDIKDIFSKYTSEDIDISYNMLDYLIQINDKINSGGVVSSDDKFKFNLLGKLGSGANSIKKNLKSTWKKSKSMAKSTYGALKTFKDSDAVQSRKGRLLKGGIGAMLGGPLGALVGYNLSEVLPLLGAGLSYAGGVAGGTVRGLAGAAGGILRGGLGLGGKLPGNIGDMFRSGVNKLKQFGKKGFVDIYVNGSFDPDNPVVTAREQEEGKIVFSDTKEPIKSSWDINRPVMDLTGAMRIIDVDLENGLVTKEGKPIFKTGDKKSKFQMPDMSGVSKFIQSKKAKLGLGGLGLMLGGPLGAVIGYNITSIFPGITKAVTGVVSSIGGVFKMFPKLLAPIKAAGNFLLHPFESIKGAFSKVKGLFGVADEEKDPLFPKATKVFLIKKQFKTLISKLDTIIKKMKSPVAGDSDGDGDRDGSFMDRMKQKLSKKKEDLSAKMFRRDPKTDKDGSGGFLSGMIDKIGGWIKPILGLLGIGGAAKMAGGAAGTVAGGAAKGGLLARGAGAAWNATKFLGKGGWGLLRGGAGLAVRGTMAALPFLTGAVTGLASAVAGVFAAISAPVWIAIGAAVVVGVAGYYAYKHYKTSDASNELLKIRISVYGMSKVDDIDHVRRLENRIYECIKEKDALTEKEVSKYLKRFKVKEDEASAAKFADWIAHRFIPQFGAYLQVIEKHKKEYSDMKKISKEDKTFDLIKKEMPAKMNSAEVSGATFNDLFVKTESDKKDAEDEKDISSIKDSKTSEKKALANKVAKVDKKQSIAPALKPVFDDKAKAPGVEVKTPKKDVYRIIADNSTTQVQILDKIYKEMVSFREYYEKQNEVNIFDSIRDISSGISSTMGKAWDKTKSLFGVAPDVMASTSKLPRDKQAAALAIAMMESSGGYDRGKNPNSSARGVTQMTDAARREMGTGHGVDAEMSSGLGYFSKHDAILRKHNIPVTNANRYLAYFLGPGLAPKLFAAIRDNKDPSLYTVDGVNLRKQMDIHGGKGMSAEMFRAMVTQKWNNKEREARDVINKHSPGKQIIDISKKS